MAFLRTLLQPRTLLLLLGAVGIVGMVLVLISASQPVTKPWDERADPLLVGEMADFQPTEFPRRVPEDAVAREDGSLAYLPGLVSGDERPAEPGDKVTLVNLWASWCAPCLEELPSLVALADRTGARIVPIAQERASEAQSRAFERAGVLDRLPILSDDDLSLSRAYADGDGRLPLTVIYDARGIEVGRLVGAADWSSPEAIRLIETIAAGGAEF